MKKPFLKKGMKLFTIFAGEPNSKPSYYILEATQRAYVCSFGKDPNQHLVVTGLCWISKSQVTESEEDWG